VWSTKEGGGVMSSDGKEEEYTVTTGRYAIESDKPVAPNPTWSLAFVNYVDGRIFWTWRRTSYVVRPSTVPRGA
jgi:hypothetical protein